MTKLIPSLLMRFDITLAHPDEAPEQHCWYEIASITCGLCKLTKYRQVVRQAGRIGHETYATRFVAPQWYAVLGQRTPCFRLSSS